MLLRCSTQYVSKFGKLNSDYRTGKVSFHFNTKERQCQKIVQTTVQLVFISHANKVMLKILQARLPQYMN